MFEKAILSQGQTRTGFGVVLGMLGQLGAIGTAILVPLVYTDRLPPMLWSTPIVVPAARAPEPPPMEVVKVAQERGAQVIRVATSDTLMAPVRIPPKVADLIEEPIALGNGQYVPGAIGSADHGVPGLPLPIGQLPAPPAEPRTPEKHATATTGKPIPRITVGGNVQAAKLLNKVIPIYPPLARQARVQGTVSLVGIVGTDGHIRALRVISGHPLLVQVALDAVRQWTYRPTMLNGQAVEVEAPIDVHFTLGQ